MSNAAKQSIFILIGLLVLVLGFTGVTIFDKEKLLREKKQVEQDKSDLTIQIEAYKGKEGQFQTEKQKLEEQVKSIDAAKAAVDQQLTQVNNQITGLNEQIQKLTAERDDFQKKFDSTRQERDDLLTKVQQKPEPQIVYKYIEKPAEQQPAAAPPLPVTEGNEAYWAQVLKEKANLELELDKVKTDLTKNAVDVVDLKKQNSDLQLEMSNLKNEKETIEQDIKHGKNLSDSLSLELARAKNDKKFISDRMAKINEENMSLREQMKKLTSTKIALEKSIVRLQEEKKETEKKLAETENVIQSRIDQIWEIKDSLDKTFKPAASSRNEVELPPIVVSSSGEAQDEGLDEKGPGYDGSVVSVNEENNFVIVDVGENSGLKLGDALSVYRGSDYIAGLEVIQLRKDISAADIKNKVAKIQVGDVVK